MALYSNDEQEDTSEYNASNDELLDPTNHTENENLDKKYSDLTHNTVKTNLHSLVPRERLTGTACVCAGRNKILIVDDNIFNIATLENILAINYKIGTDKAMNGQEAVDKVL